MQTATYTIGQSGTISLWRGLPAQITVKGLASVSGDWIFLVDSDYFDGVVLSGTVTASGADLVVTISEMNTVELANAIKGRAQIVCRATLTDGVTQVQLIPIAVKNRAVSGTPTPIAEYYTKSQIDAIIAALPTAPVLSVNSKTGDVVLDASDVGAIAEPSVAGTTGQVLTKTAEGNAWQNVPAAPVSSVNSKTGAVTLGASDVGAIATPATAGTTGQVLTETANGPEWQNLPAPPVSSVNNKTGAVSLTASDVGAVSASGMHIVPVESLTITPQAWTCFHYTMSGAATLTIDTTGLTSADKVYFEVMITLPSSSYTLTLPENTIKWNDNGVFKYGNAAPTVNDPGTYTLAFGWSGTAILGNLATTEQ